MVTIEWRDDFSVGVEEIDKQHKQLLEKINELSEAIASDVKRSTIAEMLAALQVYSNEHFATEEAYLKEKGYGGLQDHLAQHGDYMGKLAHSFVDFFEKDPQARYKLVDFLASWWTDHILAEDLKFAKEIGTI